MRSARKIEVRIEQRLVHRTRKHLPKLVILSIPDAKRGDKRRICMKHAAFRSYLQGAHADENALFQMFSLYTKGG